MEPIRQDSPGRVRHNRHPRNRRNKSNRHSSHQRHQPRGANREGAQQRNPATIPSDWEPVSGMVVGPKGSPRKEETMDATHFRNNIERPTTESKRTMCRHYILIAFLIGATIFYSVGALSGRNTTRKDAVQSGAAEYYLNGKGIKQFRWKTHAFTWSDLNFDNN